MPDVPSITINELGHLGVDARGRLYWKGRPVVVEQTLKLEWWVGASAIVAGIAAAAMAVLDVLRFAAGRWALRC